MIADSEELYATVEYALKLANALEGLRRYAQETGDTALLPLSAEGPIAHLRENLADMRAYLQGASASDASALVPAPSLLFDRNVLLQGEHVGGKTAR